MTAPLRRLRAHSVSNDLLEAATTDSAIYRNAAVHPAASTSTLELAIPGPSQISRASCSESDLSSASSSLSKLSLLDNDDSGEDDCDDFESDVRGLLALRLFLSRDLLLVFCWTGRDLSCQNGGVDQVSEQRAVVCLLLDSLSYDTADKVGSITVRRADRRPVECSTGSRLCS